METSSESRDSEVAEELLAFFVQNDLRECFCAMLYQCYELLRPDVVLELAWRNKLMDFCMPYMIQITKELSTKVETLEKSNEERSVKEELKEKQG